MSVQDDMCRIQKLLTEASADELRVLAYIAERFIGLGHKAYGKLDLSTDKRDAVEERDQELADAVIYVAFHALKNCPERPAYEWIEEVRLCEGDFRASVSGGHWATWHVKDGREAHGCECHADNARRRAEEWITKERGPT